MDDEILNRIEAAEFISDISDDPLQNQLELQKWLINPEARKSFPEITKDWLTGNLDKAELTSVHISNQCKNGLVAIRNLLPPVAMDYFLPEQSFQFIDRNISSILALSNSKDGFRIKLEKIKNIRRELIDGKARASPSTISGFLKRGEKPANEEVQ